MEGILTTLNLDMTNVVDDLTKAIQLQEGLNNDFLENNIIEAFNKGDAEEMLFNIGNHQAGLFVNDNINPLKDKGILSDIIKLAWTAHQANNVEHYPMWEKLISYVEPDDNAPNTEFIYRGVAGMSGAL